MAIFKQLFGLSLTFPFPLFDHSMYPYPLLFLPTLLKYLITIDFFMCTKGERKKRVLEHFGFLGIMLVFCGVVED